MILSNFRERVDERLHRRRIELQTERIVKPENSGYPYLGLDPYSLFLEPASFGGRGTRSINLFVPTLREKDVFAGIRTAVTAGAHAATISERRLRIISYRRLTSSDRRYASDLLRVEYGILDATLIDAGDLRETDFSPEDIWIVTWWATAHTLDVLSRRDIVGPRQVIYLIQDYEPSFYSASTQSMLASRTYHAGFTPLVNSSLLARHISVEEAVEIPADHVFRPELDLERLQTTATLRTERSHGNTVALYYRPKGRNLPQIGISTLRCIARDAATMKTGLSLLTVGSESPEIKGPNGAKIRSMGRLKWDNYFPFLASVDVLVSLQATPHPSHPPLDMVASGGHAVTNDVAGARSGLHPRLVAVPADPQQLSEAVLQLLRVQPSPGSFDSDFVGKIGRPLIDAVGQALSDTTAV